MENQDTTVEEVTSPPDFTGLEEALNQLKEVMETQLETQAEEKALEEEKALQNEEKLLQDKENSETYQENLLSVQEGQTDSLNALLVEMQTLNEQFITYQEQSTEHNTLQNQILVEGLLGVILALIIVPAVKDFFGQITKW